MIVMACNVITRLLPDSVKSTSEVKWRVVFGKTFEECGGKR